MESMTFREVTDQMVALYGLGKFEDALHLIEQHIDSFPEESARMVFWRMCLLSLTGRSGDVLSVFKQGLDAGLWWHKELFTDPDLNAVRDLPEFQRLLEISQAKYEKAQGKIERDYTILVPELPSSGAQGANSAAVAGSYGPSFTSRNAAPSVSGSNVCNVPSGSSYAMFGVPSPMM